MLVTALNPHIGYEKAAQISLKAYREDLTLREAALQARLPDGGAVRRVGAAGGHDASSGGVRRRVLACTGVQPCPWKEEGGPHLTHFAPPQPLLAILSITAESRTPTAFLTSMGGCLPPTSLAIRSPSPCSKRSVTSPSARWTPASGSAMAVVSPAVRFGFPFGRAAHLHYHRRTFPTQEVLVYSIHSRKLYS